MASDAEFGPAVKRALAERAGHVCSFPKCGASTIGPSDETPTSSSRTGMACHIFAAADGPAARRRCSNKTSEELSSIENGVWMCYTHGKLIDTDECTFTPELLADWRRIAERKASIRQWSGRELETHDLSTEELAKVQADVKLNELEKEVDALVSLGCLQDIWGAEMAMSSRDFAIEMARNAFIHGKATNVHLEVQSYSLVLSDDGEHFSPSDLKNSEAGRGGAAALEAIRMRNPELIVSHKRIGQQNEIKLAIANNFDRMVDNDPCFLNFNPINGAIPSSSVRSAIHAGCDTIFLTSEYGVTSYSAIMSLGRAIRELGMEKKEIVLILKPHSSGIKDLISEIMPNVRVVETTSA